jgi:hypothetical protein
VEDQGVSESTEVRVEGGLFVEWVSRARERRIGDERYIERGSTMKP